MKRGVWGAGQDTLLRSLLAVIRQDGTGGFHGEQIQRRMAEIGKPLTFSDADVDALLDLTYNDRRTYAVLTTVFGSDDTTQLHVDHIFPSDHMTEAQFRRAGIAGDDEIHDCIRNGQRLANLQLLEGAINKSKQARTPHDWLAKQFPREQDRAQFIQRNLLGEVPVGLSGFPAFFRTRRVAMRERLREQLQPEGGGGGS